MIDESDQELMVMYETILADYVAHRRATDQPKYEASKDAEDACEKATMLCKQQNLKAQYYIAAHVACEYLKETKKGMETVSYLLPGCICTPRSLAHYDAYEKAIITTKADYGVMLDSQWRLLKTAVSLGRHPLAVLKDKGLDFSAWFRCLVTKKEDEELMKDYGAAAAHVVFSEDNKPLKELLIRKGFEINRLSKYERTSGKES